VKRSGQFFAPSAEHLSEDTLAPEQFDVTDTVQRLLK
jgi:hypothetical protein